MCQHKNYEQQVIIDPRDALSCQVSCEFQSPGANRADDENESQGTKYQSSNLNDLSFGSIKLLDNKQGDCFSRIQLFSLRSSSPYLPGTQMPSRGTLGKETKERTIPRLRQL
jgi:hypothetical protein